MKSKMSISVARDFSEEPYGRFKRHGEFNGERFREELLRPGLDGHELVEVDLDDTFGFSSSFLEEAFGGLVRLGYYSQEELEQRLTIKATSERDKKRSWQYIVDAKFGVDVGLQGDVATGYTTALPKKL